MPGTAVLLFFEWFSVVGTVLTAVRLLHGGLYRRYRFFFFFLVFRIPYAISMNLLDPRSHTYFYVWVCTTPLTWVFYVLLVRELYGLVLERYKGLYTLGRWAMYFSVVVAVTLSLVSLLPRMKPTATEASRILGYVLATDRGVTLSLAVFLVLMMFLLSRYPVCLSRNVVLHATLFTTFFLSNTLNVIVATVSGLKLYGQADTALLGVSAACSLAWFFLLSARGEETQVTISHFGPEHEKRILYQLDALNETLLKVSRK